MMWLSICTRPIESKNKKTANAEILPTNTMSSVGKQKQQKIVHKTVLKYGNP